MSNLSLKHVLTTEQFLDKQYLARLFASAARVEKQKRLPQSLAGKVVATLFYEPSTRTRLSFEVAAQKLGASIVSTENAAQFSSAIKGESLEDSIRIIGGYVDVIILRHPVEGAASKAAAVSAVPIINAGDGAGEHPTQALLDLYTIEKEKGSLDNLTIALLGDLKNGRTIHSLVRLLTLYPKVSIYLVSPKELALPKPYLNLLTKAGITSRESRSLAEVIATVDVLYMTRIQKERFASRQEYEKLKNYFSLTPRTIKDLKKDAIILHPLPRVNEISPEIDGDSRAAYFRQAKNGLYLRMALLQEILGS